MQDKQSAWFDQWSRFKDDSVFLFTEWIYPNTLEDFRGKRVMDAGCGHGHHLLMVAPYARDLVGVDLNTSTIAQSETKALQHVRTVDSDIATVDFTEPFDMVYCIGVIHHTDNPGKTFQNLKRLTKKGGRLMVWAYAYEGNFWNRTLIEWMKRTILKPCSSSVLLALSYFLTALLYPFVWTIYLLPLRSVLPYFDYFSNFRKLSFKRNVLNAFDKLMAPQTFFIKREEVERWFNPQEFENIHIDHYKGVSWRCSGTKC